MRLGSSAKASVPSAVSQRYRVPAPAGATPSPTAPATSAPARAPFANDFRLLIALVLLRGERAPARRWRGRAPGDAFRRRTTKKGTQRRGDPPAASSSFAARREPKPPLAAG